MMINVKYLKMPSRVKGLAKKNEDDTHTIILNSCLNYEQNKDSLIHELKHIEQDDFKKDDVNEIELKMIKGE